MNNITKEEFEKCFNIISLNINGKDYITVKEFCQLTNKEPASVHWLITTGNTIRNLKALKINGRHFIPITEIFNFPFVKKGRHKEGIRTERYYLEEGALKKKEEVYTNEEK